MIEFISGPNDRVNNFLGRFLVCLGQHNSSQVRTATHCMRRATPLSWDMRAKDNEEAPLLRIIVLGLAFSFGVMVASLEMLHPQSNGFSLEVSWRTLAGFVVGVVLADPCFWVIVYSRKKKLRRAALALVAAAGVACFLYPLRFVPRQTLPSLLTGLGCAVLALSIVAGLLLLVRRFFESEPPSPKE
jgi:hypothetical protein